MELTAKFFLTATLVFSLSACVVGNQIGHSGQDASVTFGNVRVLDGNNAGHLNAVNGNIEIGKNAKVKYAETTNGNIYLGDGSRAMGLETVNGNIDAGSNATIDGQIRTVNGDITIGTQTQVAENLVTTNGDVRLFSQVVIQGDIIFEDSGMSSFIKLEDQTLEISDGAILEGRVILYKPVRLQLPANFDKNKIVTHFER